MDQHIYATMLILLSAITLTTPSKAGLLSADLSTSGDGLLTQDTSTNLEWLDLTETTNISFNDMEGLLTTDPIFSTFTRASSNDVTTLFMSAGINNFGQFRTDLVAPVTDLLDLLGRTRILINPPPGSGFREEGRGFVSDISSNPNLPRRTAGFLIDSLSVDETPNTLRGYALSPDGEAADDIEFDQIGHFLVRQCDPSCFVPEPEPQQVSEPTTFSILIFSLLGVFASRRYV